MRLVVQRVTSASVDVNGQTVGRIGPGLLVLAGVSRADTREDAVYAAGKTVRLRIFDDGSGRMNRSVMDAGGEVLAVSQFTLFGNCRKGNRPSFIDAAEPELARSLMDAYVREMRTLGVHVETGIFQAKMTVSLVNDGPVTLLIDTSKRGKGA